MIKVEISSEDEAPNYGSPIVSDEDIKREPNVPRMDRKRKKKKKIKKKGSNTLLAIIQDSSNSSDSDDVESEDSLKKHVTKPRKIQKFDIKAEAEDVDEMFDTLETEEHITEPGETQKFDSEVEAEDIEETIGTRKAEKHMTKLGKTRKFDLEVEAKDVEEMINALEAEERVPKETMRKLQTIRIKFRHTVPPQHLIETCAGSRGPTKKQKEMMEKFGPIKRGSFTPEEDKKIVENWKAFCKMHDWDVRDVQPFLYMRHQNVGFMAKFSERQKFVQFLADGLPWRTLYSVYWRFRNLYQPHLQSRYTKDEDKLIIAHMENSSAIDVKNVRKFSELAKVLHRTRASVWRRYRLLKKNRNPHKRIQWDLGLVKKMIKNLLHLTLNEDVGQLKDLDIPLVVWKKLSIKLKLDDKDLKQFWLTKLHMQLFCKEPVYLNDVKIKLIEYFYASGISEWWEIEWPNIAKHFDGMTSLFLSRTFSHLTHDQKVQGKELSEIMEYLYDVKKPQLLQAPMDKFLPRIVYKNGAVKLIEPSTNDRPKEKSIIEDSSDLKFVQRKKKKLTNIVA